MTVHDPVPSRPAGRPSSGPQGTQLFSAEELRQCAGEAAFASDGHASVHEPVLERTGGLEGERFKLRSGRQTIGRQGDNDIVVDDLSVSSSHAWIMNQQGHYVIMNTLSTNGTFVNGKRVHEAVLKHGDCIRLGQAELVFLTREHGARRRLSPVWAAAAVVTLAGLAVLGWWWWLG